MTNKKARVIPRFFNSQLPILNCRSSLLFQWLIIQGRAEGNILLPSAV
jgi:hypothetical protein